MSDRQRSFATSLLESRPHLRETARALPLSQRAGEKAIEIDGETLYVMEGDLLLDRDQVDVQALMNETMESARMIGMPMPEGLVAVSESGKVVRWHPNVVLSYAVLEETFASRAQYDTVVDSMARATQAWERTCGVKFQHKSALDSSAAGAPVDSLFVVRGIDAGGMFIAAAFFPNDPKRRRRVLIDPSFFGANLSFDRIGVLRHELGHVLGFRHEHIRSGAPPVCPDESLNNTLDLTQYDPRSVMHYFCGGVGSRTLDITELDRVGAQRVYGPSLTETTFVD